MEGRLRVNEEAVVHDVLDGQVVVVHLDSGSYYILENSAGRIWRLLTRGHTAAEVAAVLAAPNDLASVEAQVVTFADELLAEDLLTPAPADAASPSQDDDDFRGFNFEPPTMFKYDDMQALVQMDPIREYDETGWPARRSWRPFRRK
ncbi:MAG TPA: PqqD family peptide modification chaperone [Acidimicrobiales bacterium]|nr:PqqD family peptide modification chaperone [Acidimicrobiales bacterium]